MAIEHDVSRPLDGAADAEIFRVLHPKLRRFAAVIGPIEVEPDDLVQDAIERTLRVQPLTALENPGAYLHRVILNLAIDHKRRLGSARRAASKLAEDEGRTQTYPSDLDDLLHLPPAQRAVLYLDEVEGLTHAEIAEQTGMSEHAVSKASQRARKRLRTELRREMT